MLTATEQTVAISDAATQNEIAPSAAEIASRVLAIRSGWDVCERMERRRTAEQRFEKLLEALQVSGQAA